jgi:hypothetical protein
MNPVSMNHNEKAQLRAAAFRVTRLYPGPVGELISRELLAWEELRSSDTGSGAVGSSCGWSTTC